MSDKNLQGLIEEVKHGRISRRQFMERALIAGLSVSGVAAVLASCGSSTGGSSGASASPTLPPMGEAGNTLHLYNWSDYIDPATKTKFTKATGIKVVETYFDDNEALLSKLKAGAQGYDVIVPSDYMVHILWKTGLIEPLDMSAIPNFAANVGEKFKKPIFDNPDQNNGLKYSVPYQWGQTGVAQRLDKIPTELTKWADLWNPAYKNQINMLNDERETMGVGLMKVTGDPKSINSTDQATIDKATQELIAQKPLLRGYDSVNMKRNIVAGVPLVHCWNGDIILALNSGLAPNKVTLLAMEEGIPMFVDNLAIPIGAPNRKGAHMFMDFILGVKVGAANTAWVGYYSPLPAAEPLINKIDPNVYRYVPSQETIDTNGAFYDDLGAFAEVYTNAWTEVKSA
jgi:spermidine/putrescine transport system substrate-binding protein